LAIVCSVLAICISLYSALTQEERDRDGRILAVKSETSVAPEADRIPALEKTVAQLQQQLSQLQSSLDSIRPRDNHVARTETTEPAAFDAPLRDAPPPLPATPGDPPQPIVQQYFDEWGQSDWGQSSAMAIDTAALENPFFGRVGGDITTDCRQTVCRMEWFPGTLEDLSPKDREEVLGAARYEMLALASRNAPEVGQLATEWIADERGRTLVVTFEQAPRPVR
jgi:hypothetical protein